MYRSSNRKPSIEEKTQHFHLKAIWALAVLLLIVMTAVPATAQREKPNILVIWGDDIGQTNISAYTMGMVGYRTPNIDRIAKEGEDF